MAGVCIPGGRVASVELASICGVEPLAFLMPESRQLVCTCEKTGNSSPKCGPTFVTARVTANYVGHQEGFPQLGATMTIAEPPVQHFF